MIGLTTASGTEPSGARSGGYSVELMTIAVLLVPNRSPLVLIGAWFGFACAVRLRSGPLRPLPVTSRLISFFVVWLLFGAVCRLAIGQIPGLRDLTETARFVPVAILLGTAAPMSFRRCVDVVAAFGGVVGSVSLIQFFLWPTPPSIISLLGRFYTTDVQWFGSYVISRRSVGLSSGPGDNATLMLVCAAVVLAYLAVPGNRLPLWHVLSVAIAVSAAVLSQSQTGLISLGLLAAAVVIQVARSQLVAGTFRAGQFGLVASMGFAAWWLWPRITENTAYLNTLFSQGLERNSFQRRQLKWVDSVDGALTNDPWLLPVGWGKEYFGSLSSAFDSDFVFVMLVYGGVALLGYIGVWIAFIVRAVRPMNTNPIQSNLASFLLVAGLPPSIASAFFIEPRLTGLLAVVAICARGLDQRHTAGPSDGAASPDASTPPSAAHHSVVHEVLAEFPESRRSLTIE